MSYSRNMKDKASRSQIRFVRRLLKYFTDCKVILDAGCGSGWFEEILREFTSATVVGIDLIVSDQKSKMEHFLVMDTRFLGFKNDSFDLIIAKDILEHLVSPINAMKEFACVLKRGGKIIVVAPSPKARFLWDDYTHVRPFTKKSLSRLFADARFDIIDMKYLAAPTSGAALLKIERFLDLLANLGFRRGNILAIGRKLADNVR